MNISKGRKELQESHKRISSNRGLIIKVFILLFIFSFIYIVFILWIIITKNKSLYIIIYSYYHLNEAFDEIKGYLDVNPVL